MFRVTGFNMLNHPNYYVYSGSGVNQQQYTPVGPACGNKSQTSNLLPDTQQRRWRLWIAPGCATKLGTAHFPVRHDLSLLRALREVAQAHRARMKNFTERMSQDLELLRSS